MRTARGLVAALVVALAGACGGAPAGVVDKCTAGLTLPPSVSTDILFVVDNSSSMGQEQAKVMAQLRGFVDSLASAPVKNDFQIGVITTAVTLNVLNGCPPVTDSQLVAYDDQAGRLQLGKNPDGTPAAASSRKLLAFSDPDLVQQFALLVDQGVRGSGQEMPFEAVRRALSAPLFAPATDAGAPENHGLLRPGARLLVVVVTDEDDCSDTTGTAVSIEPPICGVACTGDAECPGDGTYCLLRTLGSGRSCARNACETTAGRAALTPVADYVNFFANLDDGTGTGRKREVYLAVIGPVDDQGQPVRCRSATDEANGAGRRLVEAVTALGERGLVASICDDDYSTALQRIAALVREPQVLNLDGDPADGKLLVVEIERSGEPLITCREGDGFSFAHATTSTPARITMEGRCRLRQGDKLTIRTFCAL